MKALLSIYPPFMLAMVLYAQLLALAINFDVYNAREFLILSSWIPVFTIPAILTKRRLFFIFGMLVFFLVELFNLSHWLLLKGPLSASSIFIMLNSNSTEAFDFITFKSGFRLLWLLPLCGLFILAIRNIPGNISVHKNMLLLTTILILIFFSEAIFNGRFVRTALPQTPKALISFSLEMETYKKLKLREIKKVVTAKGVSGKQVFVLIIGESCNRNHMSLYGYKRFTNPLLSLRNDMIVYKDVVSPYSNTIGSILTMMTESGLENKISFDKAISLIDIFHSLDFKTYWVSNQSPLGIWDNAVFNLARTSDVIFFSNNYGNTSFESSNLSSYDDKLLQPFFKVLNTGNLNKFVVVHLMGSHSAYSKRYPAGFRRFLNHSSSKEKLINEYDNSILYNDFVVNSLLDILTNYSRKNQSCKISAIYVGDHGENVYDENETVGHDYAGSLPRANVEIPMIIWFPGTNPNSGFPNIKSVQANTNLPFVSDDLFHAVLDLNNIECRHFIQERSVFNAKFNFERKRILEDGMDYDRKRTN